MSPEEGAPGARLALAGGRGGHTVPPEYLADRRAPEQMTELAEFTLEAAIAPPRVLPPQLQE